MKILRMRTLLLPVAVFCLTATPSAAQVVWDMPTEYPATAMPGEGLSAFAHAIEKRLGGKLVVKPSFGAENGIKSAGMIEAVASGKVQAGDAFGGALGGAHEALALASLPFLATTIDDAERLATIARPLYEKTLAALGVKLLYTTPWPPSGIWSKAPITEAGALKGLPIRTYDATSTTVFDNVGAVTTKLSFSDVMPKLKDGSVTAVLSSGDGGAGRNLWVFLPHFTAVNYAVPLSFAFVSRSAYDALPLEQRKAVDEAAKETEAHQWRTIRGRLEKNYAVMRQNAVSIVETPSADVTAKLKQVAVPIVDQWAGSIGPEGAAIIAAFHKR